jgi:hypothetical protein
VLTPKATPNAPLIVAALALAVAGWCGEARACGVSATGVASCSLAEHQEATRRRFGVGVGGGLTRTALRFDDSLRAEQTRSLVLGQLAFLPSRSLALEAGAGAALGGSLTAANGRHDFSPGPAAVLGVAYRLLDAPGYFAHFTSQLSFVWSHTRRGNEASVPYSAYDLRLGGEVGLNLVEILHPYVVARAFGGPVFWRYEGEAVTGTDIHHYQLGAGLSVGLGGRVMLVAEGIPLGEQALSAGVSVSL